MARTALLFLFLTSLIITCNISLTGNTSETTNGITVIASKGKIEGTAPPYSSLSLYRSNYEPFLVQSYDSAETDSTGTFSFLVQNDVYNLFCTATNGDKSLINILSDRNSSGDTINETLIKPGILQGYSRNKQYGSYIFLKGSPFYAITDTSGFFKISGIPKGQYSLQIIIYKYAPQPVHSDTVSQLNTSTVIIESGDTTTIEW